MAAHVRIGTGGGMGIKPPDWFTIPLCDHHHKEQHAHGERTFGRKYYHYPDLRGLALNYAARSPVEDVREEARRGK